MRAIQAEFPRAGRATQSTEYPFVDRRRRGTFLEKRARLTNVFPRSEWAPDAKQGGAGLLRDAATHALKRSKPYTRRPTDLNPSFFQSFRPPFSKGGAGPAPRSAGRAPQSAKLSYTLAARRRRDSPPHQKPPPHGGGFGYCLRLSAARWMAFAISTMGMTSRASPIATAYSVRLMLVKWNSSLRKGT